MPFSRPTLSELYTRVESDFVAMTQTGGAILRRSVERLIAAVVARVAHYLHAHIEWVLRQVFPDTAELAGLLRWGGVFGLPREEATASTGPIDFTGTNATPIPAGAEISIDGQLYTTDATVTISGGTAQAQVTASTAGAAGNASAGILGSLTNPIAGVTTQVTVGTGGLTGGADAESVETYRARLLERSGRPPRGGNEADFKQWMVETAGVSIFKSWIYPDGDGSGTVAAAFVTVDAADDTGFQIPSAGDVSSVQAYVDSVRPIFMRSFRAFAPTGATLALAIDLTTDAGADLATVRAAVETSLRELLGQSAEPGGTLALSKISEAISTTEGESSHEIVSPITDPTAATGTIYEAVAVTWAT